MSREHVNLGGYRPANLEHRRPIIDRAMRGETIEEIASDLGLNERAVSSVLARALDSGWEVSEERASAKRSARRRVAAGAHRGGQARGRAASRSCWRCVRQSAGHSALDRRRAP